MRLIGQSVKKLSLGNTDMCKTFTYPLSGAVMRWIIGRKATRQKQTMYYPSSISNVPEKLIHNDSVQQGHRSFLSKTCSIFHRLNEWLSNDLISYDDMQMHVWLDIWIKQKNYGIILK